MTEHAVSGRHPAAAAGAPRARPGPVSLAGPPGRSPGPLPRRGQPRHRAVPFQKTGQRAARARERPGPARGSSRGTPMDERAPAGAAALPLRDILVVALEQAVAAPFATRQLADLGARVIKVERRGAGDFARSYDRSVRGQSSYFVWLNRGKESIELDVKDGGDRAVLTALLSRADVFVQNLAPGAADRLGLDGDALRDTTRADHLLGIRVRHRRPLPAQEGLRPAGAVRDRPAVGHRQPRRARQGRHLGGRHRGRHVRLQRHPDRPLRTGTHRPRQQRRRVAAGGARRVDDPAGYSPATASTPRGAPAPGIRPSPRTARTPRPAESRSSSACRTSGNGPSSAGSSSTARTWSTMSGSPPTPTGWRTTVS